MKRLFSALRAMRMSSLRQHHDSQRGVAILNMGAPGRPSSGSGIPPLYLCFFSATPAFSAAIKPSASDADRTLRLRFSTRLRRARPARAARPDAVSGQRSLRVGRAKSRVVDRVDFLLGKEPRSPLPIQHVGGNQELPIRLPFLYYLALSPQLRESSTSRTWSPTAPSWTRAELLTARHRGE